MQMVKVGFTGTQVGLTIFQMAHLDNYLRGLGVIHKVECHHGDCIGADAEFAKLAYALGFVLVAHPANLKGKRAYSVANIILPEKHPLVRNHDIVDCTNILIACPKLLHEELRSGTWATVRYARKQGKIVVVIYPT